MIRDLLSYYIALHDQQVQQEGSYQETLDYLQKMHEPVKYISSHYKGKNDQLGELIGKFNDLPYLAPEKDEEGDDNPF